MTDQQNKTPVDNLKNKVSGLSIQQKWAMSCYIPMFNVVFCVLASIRMINSKFVIYHARQGLIFFAAWLATLFIAIISSSISLMLVGILFLLHIIAIISAYKNKTSTIPFVSDYVNKIPEDYVFKKLTGKAPEKELGQTPTDLPAQNQQINDQNK